MVNKPCVADGLAESVRMLVLVAGLGLNDAVTPGGKPHALRVTALLKPPDGTMLTVVLPFPPGDNVTGLG